MQEKSRGAIPGFFVGPYPPRQKEGSSFGRPGSRPGDAISLEHAEGDEGEDPDPLAARVSPSVRLRLTPPPGGED